MTERPYSAGAVKYSLWFGEFRAVVLLLRKGTSWETIQAMSEEENYFGNSSPARAKTVLNAIRRRIEAVDPSFPQLFAEVDLPTQRLLAFAAVMAADRMLFELMYERFRDFLLTGKETMEQADIIQFFEEKAVQNDTVAKWTPATLARLAMTYWGMLADAGLTGRSRGARPLYPAIFPPAAETWMKEHQMTALWKAMTGK